MKRIHLAIYFLLISVTASNADLKKAPFAESMYTTRASKKPTQEELKAVGKWAAENREVKWEILRKPNGVYEIVIHENFEGKLYKDFCRGIWGIDDGVYYYLELESTDQDTEFDLFPSYEKVVKQTDNELSTTTVGADNKPLESNEVRVKKFKLELWKHSKEQDKQSSKDNSK